MAPSKTRSNALLNLPLNKYSRGMTPGFTAGPTCGQQGALPQIVLLRSCEKIIELDAVNSEQVLLKMSDKNRIQQWLPLPADTQNADHTNTKPTHCIWSNEPHSVGNDQSATSFTTSQLYAQYHTCWTGERAAVGGSPVQNKIRTPMILESRRAESDSERKAERQR